MMIVAGCFCLLLAPLQWFFLKRYLWGPGAGRLFYKGASAFVSVITALTGSLLLGGRNWLLVGAAVLYLAADLVLKFDNLAPGVLLFLSGHLCVLGWLTLSGGSWGWGLCAAAAAAAAALSALIYYRRYLKDMGAAAPMLGLYVLVLFSMALIALSLPFVRMSPGSCLAALGGLAFSVSDLILGDGICTGKSSPFRSRAVMLLYGPGVFLITLAPFFF